jgi:hypothetical protein
MCNRLLLLTRYSSIILFAIVLTAGEHWRDEVSVGLGRYLPLRLFGGPNLFGFFVHQ